MLPGITVRSLMRASLFLMAVKTLRSIVNGQRVDLDEVRILLTELPIQPVFLPIRDLACQMRLCAFVSREKKYYRSTTTLSHDPVLVKQLYSTYQVMLPLYMIPKLVEVSVVPLNASGKIDQRCLSNAFMASFDTETAGAIRHTESAISTAATLEDTYTRIVAARVSANKSLMTEDLGHYGLTSLDFIRVIGDIRAIVGVSLTLGQVFNSPDLSSIAKAITKKLSQRLIDRHPSKSHRNTSFNGSKPRPANNRF